MSTKAKPLAPWQERVKAERAELGERITKLNAFVGTPAYKALPFEDVALLMTQLHWMRGYASTLDQRINRFSQPADDTPEDLQA